MAASIITTSRSTLMHASLAYLSSEIQALDSIIYNPLPMTAASLKGVQMPTELLLIIRTHLFPIITAQLMALSASSLACYEASLRDLLCMDCIAYNQEIYGPDIWQWTHFSGACACRNGTRRGIRDEEKPIVERPNPKKFTDPQDWLEFYLSSESHCPPGRHTSLSTPNFDIWTVVGAVLWDYDCEIHWARLPLAKNWAGGIRRSNTVAIMPLRSALRKDTTSGKADDVWMQRTILGRLNRDLGLSIDYDGIFGEGIHKTPLFGIQSRQINRKSATSSGHTPLSIHVRSLPLFMHFVRAASAIITVCVSLPFAFATLAVKILCFYSKPGHMRII